MVILQLHWSVFYDDFFLVAADEEAEHIHIVQHSFFELLGWATSAEKESDFQHVASPLQSSGLAGW